MTAKPLKIVSLLLLAGVVSGTAYARGGGGMGGSGMGHGAAGGEHAQRDPVRTQERTQQRIRARDSAQAGSAQQPENRYEFRREGTAQGQGTARARE